jgi:MFS family permease
VLTLAFSKGDTGLHRYNVIPTPCRFRTELLGCSSRTNSRRCAQWQHWCHPSNVRLLSYDWLACRMLTCISFRVGELVKKPEHEPRAYAVMPFVWSIGTIIGPSIGGYFAEPVQTFPSWFSDTGLFAKFPYLLPNLICSSLLLLSIIMAYFLLEETHPDKQPRGHFEQYDATAVAETPLLPAQGATADAPANLTSESYGTFNAVQVQRDELWRVKSNGEWVETPADRKVFTWTVIQFVIALGIFTYHSVGLPPNQ